MTKTRLRQFGSILMSFSLLITFSAHSKDKTDEAEKLYEVDIILFANKSSSISAENWPDRVEFPIFKGSRELLSPYEWLIHRDTLKETQYVFEPLNEIPDDLTEIATTLSKNVNYQLIFYKKWLQPMRSQKETRAVFITDNDEEYLYQTIDPELLKNMQLETPAEELTPEQQLLQQLLNEEKLLNEPVQTQPDFISDQDPIEPFELLEIPPKPTVKMGEELGPPHHKVFGLVKVYKSRFPHLSFDLFYRDEELNAPPEEETAPENLFPMAQNNQTTLNAAELEPVIEENKDILGQEKPPRSAYQLQESTRIRLNELHYFDHPKFGLITRIKEYKPPEKENDERKAGSE